MVCSTPSPSPDGKRAAVSTWARESGLGDLWIYELAHGIRQRFTSEPGVENTPVWSPDGRTIVYSSVQGVLPRLARRDLTATSSQYVLPESEGGFQFGGSFSPDGKNIYYDQRDRRGSHIYRVPLSAATRPQRILGTDSEQDDPRVSPDGKRLAFMTGDADISVLNLASGEQIPLTNGGHLMPRWRRDGRELFCISRQGSVVSVTPGANGDWHDASETTLFALKDKVTGFDVASDGQSFVVSEWTPGPADRLIHVVTGAIPR
jgi:Tol biopolymer transport system component